MRQSAQDGEIFHLRTPWFWSEGILPAFAGIHQNRERTKGVLPTSLAKIPIYEEVAPKLFRQKRNGYNLELLNSKLP